MDVREQPCACSARSHVLRAEKLKVERNRPRVPEKYAEGKQRYVKIHASHAITFIRAGASEVQVASSVQG